MLPTVRFESAPSIKVAVFVTVFVIYVVYLTKFIYHIVAHWDWGLD